MANNMTLEEKKKALAKLQAEQSKKYGEGSVKKASEIEEVTGTPTGILSLDMALGCKGFPKGRIVEISGANHCGKTTLVLEAIAESQRADETSVSMFVDAENGLDKNYAKAVGVDLDRLIVVDPMPAEKICDIVRESIESGLYTYIVIDSTSAMSPEIEQTKDTSLTAQIGGIAKLLSAFCRMIVGNLKRSGTTLLLTSQVRKKITSNPYENPEVVGHGEAVGFYSSIRIKVYKQKEIDSKDEQPKNPVTYTIFKNKCGGKPKAKVEALLVFGKGVDKETDILIFCMNSGVITRGGAIYKYIDNNGEELKWKGQEEVKKALSENKPLLEEILEKAKNLYTEKEEERFNSKDESENNFASELVDEEIDIEKLASVCLTEKDVEE